MTLEGTNTYVVDGYVIDPGPDDAGHLERVREAAGGGIAGVLLTHGHSDHSGGVEALGAAAALGTGKRGGARWRRCAGRSRRAPSSERRVRRGCRDKLAARPEIGPFTVIATPGHAADHVCFVRGDVCFCGDLILGNGSTIVPPAAGGGSLADYMGSLRHARRARRSSCSRPATAPGSPTRRRRSPSTSSTASTASAACSPRSRPASAPRAALLTPVWDDVPEPLRPAAAIAMQAHLEKLAAEGAARPGRAD